jgi:hypothetical protein
MQQVAKFPDDQLMQSRHNSHHSWSDLTMCGCDDQLRSLSQSGEKRSNAMNELKSVCLDLSQRLDEFVVISKDAIVRLTGAGVQLTLQCYCEV